MTLAELKHRLEDIDRQQENTRRLRDEAYEEWLQLDSQISELQKKAEKAFARYRELDTEVMYMENRKFQLVREASKHESL